MDNNRNAFATHEDVAELARQDEQRHAQVRHQGAAEGSGAGAPVRFAKVTALKLAAGGAWTDFPTDAAYPAYAEANPSDDRVGTTIDTGATVKVLLNSKADAPNGIITAVDQIVGYITIGDATYDGQAVLGMGCWLDWVRAR